MDEDEENAQREAGDQVTEGLGFYTHMNSSSSSSTVDYARGPLQISSVGFKTLKKVNTAASQNSEESIAPKGNRLARLFTKNSVLNYPMEPVNETPKFEENPGKMGEIKFPYQKRKLKLGGKKPSRIELTIQPDKSVQPVIPGSLPSDSPDTPTSRKSSISSPVTTFHNLFHRSRSYSQSSADASSPKKLQDDPQLKMGASAGRAPFAFSSSNSNSYVTDQSIPLLYNFTNPGVSYEESVNSDQLPSLGEIHRKLSVPTDLYLQSKMSKLSMTPTTHSFHDKQLTKNVPDFSEEYCKFFETLLQMIRPFFTPHLQRRQSGEKLHPNLTSTIEGIAQYIKKAYCDPLMRLKVSDEKGISGRNEKGRNISEELYALDSSSNVSLEDTLEDDLKYREIIQDLRTLFTKCMILLADDFKLSDLKYDMDVLKNVGKKWIELISLWEHFNLRVRFNIISCFIPLQISLREFRDPTDPRRGIDIENLLLSAFKLVVLVPVTLERKRSYERIPRRDLQISSTNAKDPINDEVKLLKGSNSKILSSLVNCYGVVLSLSTQSSGDQMKDKHLSEILDWFTSI